MRVPDRARSVSVLALAVALALPAFTSPRIARADGVADLDRLRKRFAEGIALEEDDKWAEALEIFREVALEKMSPQVRFHIALAEENTGKLASALAGYQEALAMARANGDTASDVVENAPKKIAALEPRVPTLIVRLESDGIALLDGEPLAKDRLGIALPVEPGKHRVAVRHGETETPVRTLTLSEGARETVTIAAPKADPIVVTPDPPHDTEPVHEDGTKVPALVVGSVGVASLVGGAVMLGLRQAAISDVTASCADPEALTGCDPAKQDTASMGQTYEYAAIGLAAGGVALLGAATVLWFTVGQDHVVAKPAPGKTSDADGVSLAIGPGGILVRGRF